MVFGRFRKRELTEEEKERRKNEKEAREESFAKARIKEIKEQAKREGRESVRRGGFRREGRSILSSIQGASQGYHTALGNVLGVPGIPAKRVGPVVKPKKKRKKPRVVKREGRKITIEV